MARLYSNENFPLGAVEVLRQLGHDVLTIQEVGQAGQALSDESVLEFARAEGRAVLTLNRKHFIRLHQQGKPHAGIIVCSLDKDVAALAQRVHEAIERQGSLVGQCLRVNRPPR